METKHQNIYNRNYIGFRKNVIKFLKSLFASAYPNYMGEEENRNCDKSNNSLEIAKESLKLALKALSNDSDKIIKEYFDRLPDIIHAIKLDVEAGYAGDPAATSEDEVILCYPAFIAIGTYRFAHPLYEMGIEIIPRVMSEYAHGNTGIDIHPGAKIGKSFFIDHGTGVVIGETTVIGDNVKLYQNVTLGSKSFSKNADGSLVKGIKRHPNIGNNVVIYAGATILGGDTYIGDNAVIGGNTWIVNSVDANEKVIRKD